MNALKSVARTQRVNIGIQKNQKEITKTLMTISN